MFIFDSAQENDLLLFKEKKTDKMNEYKFIRSWTQPQDMTGTVGAT